MFCIYTTVNPTSLQWNNKRPSNQKYALLDFDCCSKMLTLLLAHALIYWRQYIFQGGCCCKDAKCSINIHVWNKPRGKKLECNAPYVPRPWVWVPVFGKQMICLCWAFAVRTRKALLCTESTLMRHQVGNCQEPEPPAQTATEASEWGRSPLPMVRRQIGMKQTAVISSQGEVPLSKPNTYNCTWMTDWMKTERKESRRQNPHSGRICWQLEWNLLHFKQTSQENPPLCVANNYVNGHWPDTGTTEIDY